VVACVTFGKDVYFRRRAETCQLRRKAASFPAIDDDPDLDRRCAGIAQADSRRSPCRVVGIGVCHLPAVLAQ